MNTVRISNELTNLLQQEDTHIQMSVPQLVTKVLERKEGVLSSTGAIVATTGKYTGRSPKDKYIVEEVSTKDSIDWGAVNQSISSQDFDRLYHKVIQHLESQEEVFVFKGYAGAEVDSRLPIVVVNEYAWHNLFAHQLLISPNEEEWLNYDNEIPFTILSAPRFKANPLTDGTRSETFIIISFEKRTVLIGGTEYAGEIKKSVFSIMNYLLPDRNILPMHCSANIDASGDVALFFGLSGTGKTTLSSDEHRYLIGDDEHGWSQTGVFNIEGGCYAKCIHLTREKEPQIFDAISFGAVLENVIIDERSGIAQYDDGYLTENTRAAYPLQAIKNAVIPSVAGHPNTILFLTADAFGVLPPIAKLTKEQAMYHFLSGYTSKLAGTERGITAPQATFSTCFGSPFLPRPAVVYAEMLGRKMEQHNVNVFLVNTGWTGGEYGVGNRMRLDYTRRMVDAAINGSLNDVETKQDAIFGLHIPLHINGIPSEILHPRETWIDVRAYDIKATELASKFKRNFERFSFASSNIREKGGPL